MDGVELTQEYLKGKLKRRDFLKLGGVVLFANFVGVPIGNSIQARITKFLTPDESEDHEYHIGLIKSVFGDFKSNFKLTPGTGHYLLNGRMHPDDVSAAKTLEKIGLSGIDNIEYINGFFSPEDFQGNFISLGSPNSNFLTRSVLGYKYINEKVPELGLEKKDLFFDLPFEYILDSEYLLSQGATYKRKIKNKILVGTNWAIRDNINGVVIVPETLKDGRLKNDYLLITVLPNYLSKNENISMNKIIIFGGAHGTGTMAIELLFRDKEKLEIIKNRTKRIDYFQVLIKIKSVIYNSDFKHSPYKLDDNLRIEPINFHFNKFEKIVRK